MGCCISILRFRRGSFSSWTPRGIRGHSRGMRDVSRPLARCRMSCPGAPHGREPFLKGWSRHQNSGFPKPASVQASGVYRAVVLAAPTSPHRCDPGARHHRPLQTPVWKASPRAAVQPRDSRIRSPGVRPRAGRVWMGTRTPRPSGRRSGGRPERGRQGLQRRGVWMSRERRIVALRRAGDASERAATNGTFADPLQTGLHGKEPRR